MVWCRVLGGMDGDRLGFKGEGVALGAGGMVKGQKGRKGEQGSELELKV